MKKILLFIIAFASMSANAQSCLTEVIEEKNYEVKNYTSDGDTIERTEYLSEYMSKKEALGLYKRVLRSFEENVHYTRLNGGRTHILFVEDGDINRNVVIALLKSSFGYRVVIAYDNFIEK